MAAGGPCIWFREPDSSCGAQMECEAMPPFRGQHRDLGNKELTASHMLLRPHDYYSLHKEMLSPTLQDSREAKIKKRAPGKQNDA